MVKTKSKQCWRLTAVLWTEERLWSGVRVCPPDAGGGFSAVAGFDVLTGNIHWVSWANTVLLWPLISTQNYLYISLHTHTHTHPDPPWHTAALSTSSPKLAAFQLVRIGTLCRRAQNDQSDGRLGSFHRRALQCSHVHSPVKLHSPLITLPPSLALSSFPFLLNSLLLILTSPMSPQWSVPPWRRGFNL